MSTFIFCRIIGGDLYQRFAKWGLPGGARRLQNIGEKITSTPTLFPNPDPKPNPNPNPNSTLIVNLTTTPALTLDLNLTPTLTLAFLSHQGALEGLQSNGGPWQLKFGNSCSEHSNAQVIVCNCVISLNMVYNTVLKIMGL